MVSNCSPFVYSLLGAPMPTASDRLKPRKTPVQARAAETRDRILEAGARVFSRLGYSAGTTNRIAAEASLSVGSLYQYFPSKDAILVELVRRHLADGTDRLLAALAAAGGAGADLPVVLGAVVDAMIANHAGDPALHQVLFEEAPRPPELLAELHDLEARAIAMVSEVLAATPGVRVGDVDMAARLVTATVESLVHRVVATRDRTVDLGAFRDELVTMLTRYLLP
jgi:AcrR family transcriptional regulator